MSSDPMLYEFLPALLRRTLAPFELDNEGGEEGPRSLQPFSVPCYGAVLLADISGFTRLSSSMNAEELKLYINSFFSKILSLVELYSGDVIKFCGDALIIVWPVDADATDSEKSAVISMATKCAVNFVSSPRLNNVLNLKLHCGIGAGMIHCMHLGNSNQMEFLVSGDPIHECGLAASEASLGEVCWSPNAYELIKHKYVGVRKPLGSIHLTECVFYDINCPHCTIYAGLFCNTPPLSPAKKRSSPQVIRGRSGSGSGVSRATSSRSIHSQQSGESPPTPGHMTPNSPMAGSPLLSPRSPFGNSTDLSSSLSPRATDLLQAKGMASPERPNKVELPHLKPLLHGDGSPLSSSPSGSHLSRIKHHRSASNSPTSKHLSSSGSPASFSRLSGTASSQAKPSLGSSLSSNTPQSESTLNLSQHRSESLASDKSVTSVFSDSGNANSIDAEQWGMPKRRSLLDNIAESLEKVKSNFSSNDIASVASADEVQFDRTGRRLNALRNPGRLRSNTSVEKATVDHSALHRYTLGGRTHTGPSSLFASDSKASTDNSPQSISSPITLPGDMSDIEDVHRLLHLEEERHEAGVKTFLAPYVTPASYKYTDHTGKSTLPAMGTVEEELKHADSDNHEQNSDLYRLFLPPMAYQFVEEEGLDSLAEMRRVTTMFVEILDAAADFTTGCVDRPQRAIRTILSSLNRFGGFLRQYVVDDKGCVAVIGFGVPGYCHDDNSARSIEAGAYIRRHLRSASMRCKIGIAVGNVYCGLVGSTYRCEYAMMGASVNLAARLMGKSEPGQILVTERVSADTRKLYLFEELPKVTAKGYKLPIAVFTPICRNTGRSALIGNSYETSPIANVFIGRTYELDMFSSILGNMTASAISGGHPTQSQTLIAHAIEGPAGIGKSWLTAEIQCMCSRYTSISCCSATAAAPTAFDLMKYDIIGQLLEQLLGISAALLSSNMASRRLLGEMAHADNPSFSSSDSPSGQHSRASSILPSFSPSRADSTGSDDPKASADNDRRVLMMDHIEEWFQENVPKNHCLTISKSQVPRRRLRTLSSGSLNATYARNVDGDDDEESDYEHGSDRTEAGKLGGQVSRSEEFSLKASDALALLNSVLPVKFPVSDAVVALSAEERTKFRDALLVLILTRCIDKNPTVLIVARMHWCDIPSLRVLYQILIRSRPIFLCTVDPAASLTDQVDSAKVALHRGDDSDPFPKILSLCRKHVLQPFTHDEIESLLKGIVGQRLLDMEPQVTSESNISLIAARTAGNPYLVSTLSVRIREVISSCTFKDINSLVHGRFDMSINNFDSLSRYAQFVLKVASIIGMSFSELDLFRLSSELKFSAVALDLAEILSELQSRGFIAIEEGSSTVALLSPEDKRATNVYRFLSSSVYQNVNHLILQKQKEKAHGAYAKLLEPRLLEAPELLDLVVDHYSKSDMQHKKVEFYNRGLEQAQSLFSCSLVDQYTQELVVLFTDSTIPDLLQYCCTPQPKAAARDDSYSIPFLRRFKQRGVAQIPRYIQTTTLWLSPSDFVVPVTNEEDTDFLSGYIALSSVVLFRRGFFRECYNRSLLALHSYRVLEIFSLKEYNGMAKWLFSGTKSASVSLFMKNPRYKRLRQLPLSAVRLIVALYIQLGVISLMCTRSKLGKFYISLATTLKNFAEVRFKDLNFFNYDEVSPSGVSLSGFPTDYNLSLLKANDVLLRLSTICEPSVAATDKSKPLYSSTSSSLKTDHESMSADWDLNDSMDDCSASLSRSRIASSGTDVDYMADSKFVLDAVVRLNQGLSEAGMGRFSAAYSTFGWSIHALNIDTDDFGATFRQMLILKNAWVALLSGNVERSKVICRSVLEYSRAFKQSLLCKWALELDMLHQLLSADFSMYSITSAIEHCIGEIKNRTVTDTVSPCSSAILALSYVMDKDTKRAFPLAKFAVAKLRERPAITLVPGIFLFIAGYAAALMMQHDNTYFRSLPSDVSVSYRDQSPRVYYTCKEIVCAALNGLSMMSKCAQPCLSLLHDALNTKLAVATSEGTNHANSSHEQFGEGNLSKYNEFIFAKAFVYLERLNFTSRLRSSEFEDHLSRQNQTRQGAEFYFKKLSCPASTLSFFAGSKQRGQQRRDSHSAASLSNYSTGAGQNKVIRLSRDSPYFFQQSPAGEDRCCASPHSAVGDGNARAFSSKDSSLQPSAGENSNPHDSSTSPKSGCVDGGGMAFSSKDSSLQPSTGENSTPIRLTRSGDSSISPKSGIATLGEHRDYYCNNREFSFMLDAEGQDCSPTSTSGGALKKSFS